MDGWTPSFFWVKIKALIIAAERETYAYVPLDSHDQDPALVTPRVVVFAEMYFEVGLAQTETGRE